MLKKDKCLIEFLLRNILFEVGNGNYLNLIEESEIALLNNKETLCFKIAYKWLAINTKIKNLENYKKYIAGRLAVIIDEYNKIKGIIRKNNKTEPLFEVVEYE